MPPFPSALVPAKVCGAPLPTALPSPLMPASTVAAANRSLFEQCLLDALVAAAAPMLVLALPAAVAVPSI